MSRYSKGRIEKDWTMVGLKTFWLLISTLFLLAACVPQTKQTECGANEAFNASLRTCVPVVGGPSSFINISSFVPQFTQSRQKDDSTTLTFTIAVSNPYNQSFSVEWERVFNAAPVTMCSNALSCSFSASLLGTTLGEVGTHILTAKVKDGNGAVVDSHAFEIKINDFPKPQINTSTLNPSSYAFDALPSDPRIPFSFTVRNNNATISASDNYRTVWTIVRNGSVLYTESDSFTSFSLTGTNNAYLGVSPTSAFNPATLGVGSYIVRATVQNDVPGEIVAEQQWNVIIKEPDLANVTTIAQPAPGVVITAHNNVAYPAFPTLSWIYSGTIQPNFCVTLDDRDGTYADASGVYPNDGDSIQVRWYLDGLGGDICTKKTLNTPGTQTICLIDANNCDPTGANLPFDTSLLQFSNANAVTPQTHRVTARLFDMRTSQEFQRSDVLPSNGSYPIEWLVNNKPINTAPSLGFGSTQPTGCVSSGAFTRSSCAVTQGTNFTVSFTTVDDFYSPITNAGEFNWDFKVKYNGADISNAVSNTSCTKAFGTAVTVPAPSGPYNSTTPNKWTCTMAVPNYVATGPLNPSSGSYSVVATMQDSGSPVGGAGLASQSLTWNLIVSESNTPLVLSAQGAGSTVTKGAVTLAGALFASELETINFNMEVNDTQVDNLQYQISICKDNTLACTNPQAIFVPGYTQVVRSMLATPDLNPRVLPSLAYFIPEDFLIGLHSPSIDIAQAVSRPVFFKIQVSDVPSVLATVPQSDEEVFSINVQNINTVPTIDSTAASPAVGSTTIVYSGYPLTIDPGTVTDLSGPASERNLQYQWYAKIGAGAYSAIPGAASRILRYTPGNIITNIDLKLCFGDGTAAHTTASTGACSGIWTITPKQYLENLTATGIASVQDELAVWYDDTNSFPNTQVIYSAYADSNFDIFVEKTVKNAAGNIILTTNTVRFPALQTGTPSILTNLSITGSADSVYVAYLASIPSAPSTMIPRVRRIDKFYDLAAPAQAKVAMDHPAPFGFSYAIADFSLTGVCTGGALTCVFTPGNGTGGPSTIEFLDRLTIGDTIEINGETFTADPTPTLGTEICDSSACATVNSQAENLRDKINNSTLASMHGITARTNGGAILEIYSQYTSDYLDFDGSIGGVPGIVAGSNGLGKIFMSAGRWNIPLINASLGGAEQNNISMISGTTDVHLRNGGLALSTNDVLQEMGKVAAFDSKLNAAGELVIAKISADVSDAGALSMYRYSPGASWTIFDTTGGSATDQNNIDIFTAFSFESVKLATNAVSNPHYYILAKEKSINGGEYHIGRYNFELDSSVTPSENFLSTRLVTTDSTPLTISDSLLKSADIISIPGFSEARIFFHSVGTGLVPYPRIAKWTAADTVACGICAPLNGSQEYDASAKIGISQIANNITLGTTVGASTNNINDVVFALFSTDIANDDIFKPQLAIINVESEAVQSTTVDAAGMWRPPFVLD